MRCEVCGQTVPTALSLRLHLRNVHKIESAGMSTRAIAPVVGVSDRQVRYDAQVSRSYSPEPAVNVETGEVAARDPLAPLEALGIRPVWVRHLGDPAVHVPSHHLLLLDADLSRAEVFGYVRQLLGRLTA